MIQSWNAYRSIWHLLKIIIRYTLLSTEGRYFISSGCNKNAEKVCVLQGIFKT